MTQYSLQMPLIFTISKNNDETSDFITNGVIQLSSPQGKKTIDELESKTILIFIIYLD